MSRLNTVCWLVFNSMMAGLSVFWCVTADDSFGHCWYGAFAGWFIAATAVWVVKLARMMNDD